MRAGPVSAAAMRVPVPAADQHAPFPHAHCGEAEYDAFLDGLALRPEVRRQRRNHRRRFARLWPDLGAWFSLPLDTRVARRAQSAKRSLHHRASYDDRSYLYYLALTDRTRLDYDWLLAIGDLRLAEVARPLGIDLGIDLRLLLGSRVVADASCDQGRNEGAEQGFAASARVVHELEEAEVIRQLVLRDAAVRAKPRSQERPETLHGVDVDLAKTVPVLVAGVFAAPVADRLVPVAPGRQAGVDAILVRVDEGARGDSGGDDRLDRPLLHVGQQMQDHLAAALDQAEDRGLVLFQRAAARRACQPAAAPEPPLLAISFGWPLCPAAT